VGDDVFVDSEAHVVTSSISKSTRRFSLSEVFIGVEYAYIHRYESVHVYMGTVFLKTLISSTLVLENNDAELTEP
jgi:hypothetical protein